MQFPCMFSNYQLRNSIFCGRSQIHECQLGSQHQTQQTAWAHAIILLSMIIPTEISVLYSSMDFHETLTARQTNKQGKNIALSPPVRLEINWISCTPPRPTDMGPQPAPRKRFSIFCEVKWREGWGMLHSSNPLPSHLGFRSNGTIEKSLTTWSFCWLLLTGEWSGDHAMKIHSYPWAFWESNLYNI